VTNCEFIAEKKIFSMFFAIPLCFSVFIPSPFAIHHVASRRSAFCRMSACGRLIKGGSMLTWNIRSPILDDLHVALCSDGRPFDAEVELWDGPADTPFKMRIFNQDGRLPVSAIVGRPPRPHAIAIRNIGKADFPVMASVVKRKVWLPDNEPATIGGGTMKTFSFHKADSIRVRIETSEPLRARIELAQKSCNIQVMEVYREDTTPFTCTFAMNCTNGTLRVINTASSALPMLVNVAPSADNMTIALCKNSETTEIKSN
jgi:hypothetical protein